MKLVGFDISVLAIPLRIDAAQTAETIVRSIFVRLRDETGRQGWGECPTGAAGDDRRVEVLRDRLRHEILPALASRTYDGLTSVADASRSLLEGLPMNAFGALCAAETALLDLMGRRQMTSAGEILGPLRRPEIRYAGRIASGGDISVKEQAVGLRRQAVQRVTLELTADHDANHRHLEMVRQILGDDVDLRIAVDGPWDTEAAIRELEAMAAWRIGGVEQPVTPDDIDGMAAVTAAGFAPVIATGSVTTPDSVVHLAAERACDIVSIRISRCGGLSTAGVIHRIARDAGLGCQLEAEEAEAGLLSAAGRHFAGRLEGVNYCECASTPTRLPEPLTKPSMAVSLAAPVTTPRSPGLGLRVCEDAVARYATQRISLA